LKYWDFIVSEEFQVNGDLKGGNSSVREMAAYAAQLMQINLLKSKIHRAAVTASNVNYEGSMTIDQDLMEKVGFVPYEKILASNMANGQRFETYVIAGERGSGQIVLNGATAHLGKPGDRLTIMSFAEIEASLAKKWQPRVIVLDEQNKIVNERGI
jgi:aspartate 1-decarboxylase